MAKFREVPLENECDFHLPEDVKCKGSAGVTWYGWVEAKDVVTENEDGSETKSQEFTAYRAEGCSAVGALTITKFMEIATAMTVAIQRTATDWLSGKRPVLPPAPEVPKKSGGKAPVNPETTKIREWAEGAGAPVLKALGLTLNPRGKLPEAVVNAYNNSMK